MITFVLIVAGLNFALGYGLAMTLAPSPGWSLPRLKFPTGLRAFILGLLRRATQSLARSEGEPSAAGNHVPDGARGPGEPSHVDDEPHEEPAPSVFDGMSQSWIQLLTSTGIEPQSFAEAAVHVLRLEVGRYREQLVACDSRAREAQAIKDAAPLDRIRADLQRINIEWLKMQREAAGVLSERRGKLGDFEDAAQALEDILLDQAAQIETTGGNLENLDFLHDPSAAKRMIVEMSRLVDLAHAVRDRMQETMALIAGREGRLDSLSGGFSVDPQTTLFSRLGFQKLFQDWRRGDATNMRLASIVLVDIDRFGKLNERLGIRMGDRMLGAIGREMSRFVRRDRGYDRACRLAGERFLLFLGDTGPRQALSAAERIRQSIEALSLECDGTEVEFTVSCGVCELTSSESVDEILLRLDGSLKEARKAGRNRTALDEGDGPKLVNDPPRFQVKARVVLVKDE